MSIELNEVSNVWVLKDMQFTSYDEGEDLIHEATYGFFVSRESAERAAAFLEEKNAALPQGNWVIYDEIVYE